MNVVEASIPAPKAYSTGWLLEMLFHILLGERLLKVLVDITPSLF